MKDVIFLGQKRKIAFKTLERMLEGYRFYKSMDSVLLAQTKKTSELHLKKTDKRVYLGKD